MGLSRLGTQEGRRRKAPELAVRPMAGGPYSIFLLLCSWPPLSFLPRSPVLVGSSSFKKNTAIQGSPRNFNLYRNWCLESEVSIARGQKKRKCISCLFIVPSNGGRGGELVLLGLLLGISSTHNDTNLTVQPAP